MRRAACRQILHLKLFHPANDHYGLSPIEAAATAIDIHNTAAGWNKALLDNSARPSGALVYGQRRWTTDGGAIRAAEDGIGDELPGRRAMRGGRCCSKAGSTGSRCRCRREDMDFIEAKNAAAREIALAIGVPPMLLGIPGDNTYSNYQEATRSFWRQTVLPLVNRTAMAFTGWLAPAFGSGLLLRPNLDDVEALTFEREALWRRLDAATFLSRDEKREAAGYPPETSA